MKSCSFCLSLIISWNITLSRSIHVLSNGKISFLWLNSIPLCVYTHIDTDLHFSLSIHPSVDTWVVSILWLVNTATVNLGVHIPFWVGVFICFVLFFFFCFEQPELELLGPYGKSILNSLRNLHTSFHSGCTKLNSHKQSTNVSFLHPFQNLSLVLITAILTHVGW